MKLLVIAFALVLAGCRTVQQVPLPAPAAAPVPPAPPPANTRPEPSPELVRKVQLQAQYIEALLSQNDALRTKLSDGNQSPPAGAPTIKPSAVQPATGGHSPFLIPNAEGVIDLVAADGPATSESVNPFAVRTAVPGAAREVSIRVGGIIAGPVACAVIDDRLLQVGETIESLTVDRIEPDAVILRFEKHQLRLPVAEASVRVRIPN